MNTTTENTETMIPKGFKKTREEILSIRDFPEGVTGVIGEVTQILKDDGTPILGNYDQELFKVKIGAAFYWVDGGLRGEIKAGKVMPGETVFVAHAGEGTFERLDEKTGKMVTAKVQKYVVARETKLN